MVASISKPGGQRSLPRHIAIIMDGNGRWARSRALPRQAGHKAGIKPVRATVERCAVLGVETLTLFAFSSENWRRPRDEVSGLMSLFVDALRREVAELDDNGIRLRFVGEISSLNPVLQKAIRAAETRTRNNSRMNLVLAVAYGGRWDIANGARKLAQAVVDGKLTPEEIDEACFESALAMADFRGVDLLIRTGGEKRISNFLLWNLAYSELYFSDLLWPDFSEAELDRALEFYQQRQRRFGVTGEQVEATSG
ncbi:MAG TPA: polyprenyl diphosphate synthase [Gammaproteobacteria bacterium]